MIRRATLVITPTESVRREACELLGVPAGKVVAVPEAPRVIFRPLAAPESRALLGQLGIGGDFILAVGTVEPRKNLARLVRAFELLTRDAATPPGLRLVLAGQTGWLHEDFLAQISASRLRERVHFTGYVTDAELRALYSSCRAFAYPSLYEGFGLPPLEAMACGAAVVAARIPTLVETLGEDAAALVDPEDVEGLAAALADLLGDENARSSLSAAGRERAAQFTWERAARLTLDVYAQAAGREI